MEKINYKDLVIVGDSFCGHRTHKDHWPKMVSDKLVGENPFDPPPRGEGYPGASWWSTRNRLIKELRIEPPKVLIITHTEPHRLPNKDDWGVNFRSAELGQIHRSGSFDKPMPLKFKEACQLYYTQLWMAEYHEWAIQQWFKELDDLIKDVEYVLHFYAFEGEYNNYIFKKGVTFADPLINYQVKRKMFSLKEPVNANHFDVETNRRFADCVLKYINEYPGDGVRIESKLL